MSKALPILLALAAAPLLATCQQYEFEEVNPKAIAAVNNPINIPGKRSLPKMMLVVDKSGSMKADKYDYVNPICTTDADASGNATTALGMDGAYDFTRRDLPCKWNSLLKAFTDPTTGFLANAKDKALFGLTVFPAKDTSLSPCATGERLVQVGTSPGDTVPQIINELNLIAPSGGTPTATTLQTVASDDVFMAEAPGQDRFVLLLTDGQPNCNQANESKCGTCEADDAACFGPGACYPLSLQTTDPDCMYYPSAWATCWDGEALSAQVRALREKGVYTFVIGFGGATGVGEAKVILNAAAVEGGKAQEGDVKFFQADNLVQLQQILDEITASLQSCDFTLDPAPADHNANLLQVVLEDKVQGGEPRVLAKDVDWTYTAQDTIGMVTVKNSQNGDWCDQLQIPDRFTLTFRYATGL